MSGRDIEAEVLAEAASRLRECQENWGIAGNTQKLDEALQYNQKAWSVLQSELLSKDNPLPQRLKEDLLSLSAFIDKRTFETMAFPAPEKISILIKINSNLAAGLRSSQETVTAQANTADREKTSLGCIAV